MSIEFTPIGIAHTPFSEPADTPRQAALAKDALGTVEVFPDYREGLKDLEGFSHIILLFHFHRSHGFSLTLTPRGGSDLRGVFATRAPRRPNAIGFSVVRLRRIEDGILHVRNIDMLDGTPLLDIKPYIPEFDAPADAETGWFGRMTGDDGAWR